jgi:hypothetical protein
LRKGCPPTHRKRCMPNDDPCSRSARQRFSLGATPADHRWSTLPSPAPRSQPPHQ